MVKIQTENCAIHTKKPAGNGGLYLYSGFGTPLFDDLGLTIHPKICMIANVTICNQ
jgi:hypothetical protein